MEEGMGIWLDVGGCDDRGGPSGATTVKLNRPGQKPMQRTTGVQAKNHPQYVALQSSVILNDLMKGIFAP